ncbi:MAG TPA: DUF58 domain-containing protein [Anaerolineales bacterium]|nr:DUF58 domain-containing protein [Anaerolineales bacterium]
MRGNTSRLVIWLLFGVSLVALATTGSEIYSRLTYLWLILIAGTWLWSKLSLRGVEVTRHPRIRRAHIGQIFEERFEVHNPGRLPKLWLEVRDHATLPGTRGSHVITLIGSRQRRAYLARSRLMQRGIFNLGPTTVASGDPFGFFPVERQIPVESTLLVYPLMVEVQSFPNPPGVMTGGEALQRRTHYVTPNAAGVREYMPGDSLNRIHWKTTVRKDKLMVKEFELDPQADIWLFVDGERAVHSALPYTPADLSRNVFLQESLEEIKLPPTTEEYAATVSASLARFYLGKRRAVGIVSSSRSVELLPPDRGGRQLGKILETLSLLRADGTLPMSGLIEAQARHITRGSTLVVITPSVRSHLPLTLDYAVRRGLKPIVVLIDSASFGGAPGTGGLHESIKAMRLPVRIVANGDRIDEALITTR